MTKRRWWLAGWIAALAHLLLAAFHLEMLASAVGIVALAAFALAIEGFGWPSEAGDE